MLIGDVSFGGRSRFRSDRAIKKGRRLRSQAALVPAARSGLVTGGGGGGRGRGGVSVNVPEQAGKRKKAVRRFWPPFKSYRSLRFVWMDTELAD